MFSPLSNLSRDRWFHSNRPQMPSTFGKTLTTREDFYYSAKNVEKLISISNVETGAFAVKDGKYIIYTIMTGSRSVGLIQALRKELTNV